MLKDLNTDTTTTISTSETLLPFTNDTNRLSLNDKYCWWTAYNINDFSKYRVIVYDISLKRETVLGNDNSQIANPSMSGDDIIYTRKSMTTVPSFEIWHKKMNSKKLTKKIHQYNLKANSYSVPSTDNGYTTWVDEGDLFVYDINKETVKRITQTSEPEYFPIIQNGIIYFNRLSYINWKLVYTIHAYSIKEGVFFKVNIKEGFHWQRPSYNPNADNFVFTQQYTDNTGKNVFSLCLYDPKNDMVKEIQRFPTFLSSTPNALQKATLSGSTTPLAPTSSSATTTKPMRLSQFPQVHIPRPCQRSTTKQLFGLTHAMATRTYTDSI